MHSFEYEKKSENFNANIRCVKIMGFLGYILEYYFENKYRIFIYPKIIGILGYILEYFVENTRRILVYSKILEYIRDYICILVFVQRKIRCLNILKYSRMYSHSFDFSFFQKYSHSSKYHHNPHQNIRIRSQKGPKLSHSLESFL